MHALENVKRLLSSAPCAEALFKLYGGEAAAFQAERYARLASRFFAQFPQQTAVRLLSAPGRAEIGGNHTDHQRGRVLAAAVNLDTVAAAAKNGGSVARIDSEGFAPMEVDLSDLSQKEAERGTTAAIVRGCAARMADLGVPVGGFDASVTSSVLVGSGLSSSAAFEVLVCAILDALYGEKALSPVARAKAAQYAENVFFGKPSGLMDQMASSVGGLVAIDFGPKEPDIAPLTFDFLSRGYALAVVNTGGSHGDLTDAYAAIRAEMEQVAALFEKPCLRSVDPGAFERELPALYGKVSDRALLRAMHFFDENARVAEQTDALRDGDLSRFFDLVTASGDSSWKLLQNVWATPSAQPIALALALSRRMLEGRGAFRVHGGGFAGTILAFVPLSLLDAYRALMDAVFGNGACQPLRIRPAGAYELILQ